MSDAVSPGVEAMLRDERLQPVDFLLDAGWVATGAAWLPPSGYGFRAKRHAQAAALVAEAVSRGFERPG